MVCYYAYYHKGKPTKLAKLDNRVGYTYENGEWEKYPYIERELYEDTGFDEISKEEAEKLMEEV